MRVIEGSLDQRLSFLRAYRTRLLSTAMLLFFGVCAGRALFQSVYCAGIEAYCAQDAFLRPAMLPGRVLLYALLPPCLYGATMILSACSALATPLWCVAVVCAGACGGTGGAFAAALLRNGAPGVMLFAAVVLRTCAAGALAVYAPVRRGGDGDATQGERACIGALFYLIVEAATVSVTGAAVVRALFD